MLMHSSFVRLAGALHSHMALRGRSMENENLTKPFEGKQIQEIWSEAFATGKAVLLCGKIVDHQFIKAWFRCIDERTYPLTAEELKEYKPDARIHEDYRYDAAGKNNTRPASPELRTGR